MNGCFKLSDKQVIEIVQRYNAGERAQALADEFGVSCGAVLKYIRNNPSDIELGDGRLVKRSPRTGCQPRAGTHGARLGHNSRYDIRQQEIRRSFWEKLQ